MTHYIRAPEIVPIRLSERMPNTKSRKKKKYGENGGGCVFILSFSAFVPSRFGCVERVHFSHLISYVAITIAAVVHIKFAISAWWEKRRENERERDRIEWNHMHAKWQWNASPFVLFFSHFPSTEFHNPTHTDGLQCTAKKKRLSFLHLCNIKCQIE